MHALACALATLDVSAKHCGVFRPAVFWHTSCHCRPYLLVVIQSEDDVAGALMVPATVNGIVL
jgi:hypothetical protein